jgi:hypothetical protein
MNPVALFLAALIGTLKVLYDSFVFTDSGANKMKATVKALGDSYDQLKGKIGKFIIENQGAFDSVLKFISTQTLLGQAISALGDAFTPAIEGAQKYVDTIDNIDDRETAYISKAAENKNKIAKLEFLAANPNEVKQKRIEALQEAINLQDEEAAHAKKVAEERYKAELADVARTQGISVEKLDAFIKMDDDQYLQAIKTDKQLKDLTEVNHGDYLKNLEGFNAAVVDADTAKFEGEKNNMKKMERLLAQMDADSAAARKKKEEAEKKAAEEAKKRAEDEIKRQADLFAFYNKSIDEQIFALETQQMDKKNKNELMFVDEIDFENKMYAWRIQKAGLSYDQLERLRVEHEAKMKEITDNGGDGGDAFKLLVKEREDYLKAQKDQLEKQKEEVRKAAEQMLTAVEDGLKERAKLQQDADQKAIDNQKKQVDRQAQLAAAGKENSLAAEEAFLAKAERKKIDDAKKAQKAQESLELAKVFLNLVAEYSKTNPDNATAKALAMTLIAKGISKSIAGAFATGVEGLDGEGTETSDSNIALLSKGESVITAKGTRNNPGLASAMNSGMVDEYFNSVYMPQFASSNRLDIPKAEQVNNALFKVLNHKLESLESAIREKPVSMTKLNGLGEWTEEVQSNNMRIITHHRKGGNRF